MEIAVKRADRGDQNALQAIRLMFDKLPTLWDGYGNLAAAAEAALVDLYAGQSALAREGLCRKLATMRARLAGPEASPLEQMLVERVVACWLQSFHADFAYARALKELSSKEVEFYQRRQDRATRQYLKALRSLAEVRRLLVPLVQLNVAENQVNIAAAPGATVGSSRRGRRDPGTPRPATRSRRTPSIEAGALQEWR
jgi:alcohol dehydrogenase class IV